MLFFTNLKTSRKFLMAMMLLAVSGFSASAVAQQPVMHRMEFTSEGDVLMIAELGIMLTSKDSSIVIEHAMPTDSRPDKYRKIDVRQGDRIIMVNGSRVSTPSELSKKYEALEVGQMFKMAIKRNGAMIIVSFEKASKEDLGGNMIITQVVDDSGHEGQVTMPGGGKQIKMFNGGGGDMQIEMLPALGIIVSHDGEKCVVMSVIPGVSNIPQKHNIVEGDVIKSIQGISTASFDDFKTTYSEINAGDELTIEIERDGEVRKLSFPKPEAKNIKMIKKQDK